MAGRLVEAQAVAGFFLDQQKPAIPFNDSSDSNRGFPDVSHDFPCEGAILPCMHRLLWMRAGMHRLRVCRAEIRIPKDNWHEGASAPRGTSKVATFALNKRLRGGCWRLLKQMRDRDE
jgi:hypothetical protein